MKALRVLLSRLSTLRALRAYSEHTLGEAHSPKAPPWGNYLQSILSQAVGLFTYRPWFM